MNMFRDYIYLPPTELCLKEQQEFPILTVSRSDICVQL